MRASSCRFSMIPRLSVNCPRNKSFMLLSRECGRQRVSLSDNRKKRGSRRSRSPHRAVADFVFSLLIRSAAEPWNAAREGSRVFGKLLPRRRRSSGKLACGLCPLQHALQHLQNTFCRHFQGIPSHAVATGKLSDPRQHRRRHPKF
jgi:hypothetical protein